jgi:hypothetical protein
MPRRIGMLLCAALCSALTFGAVGTAHASPLIAQTLYLDTHEAANDGAAGPVATNKPLAPNAYYFVSVRGTFSAWGKSELDTNGMCGTPEAAPIYPSPGVDNGRVGLDPEFTFAASKLSTYFCSQSLPVHNQVVQMDNGTGFAHREPIGGVPSRPSYRHVYRYLIKGAGTASTFRSQMVDDPLTDNYGKLKIFVRLATPFDCFFGGYTQFGTAFRNQGQCVSYFVSGLLAYLHGSYDEVPADPYDM